MDSRHRRAVARPDRVASSRSSGRVADLKAGKAVVVVDDEDRENEGDLIFAAEMATPELVSFMVRYTSGYICVALTEGECDRLDLPPMHHTNADRFRTAFTVTVDAKAGITTGISAADRAHTIRLLADPAAGPGDLVRPGHVLPLRAREGGVLRRPGHTEAAVDLARLAGLSPGRRALRDRLPEGRRGHGPRRRAGRVRRRPRAHADHDRRPDRLPAALREARGAGGAGPDPDRARRVPRLRLRLAAGRHRAHRDGPRRRGHPGGHRRGRAGAGALGVPDRRRVRLAALRLRAAAGRRARRGGRRGPRRGALHARARGPRHRPAAQAAGLPAAGGRRRHRRRQPRARACPPTPATTASARRSWSTSGSARCGC